MAVYTSYLYSYVKVQVDTRQSENAYIRITFIQLAVASIIPDTLRTPAFNINILKMKTEQEISVVNPDLVGSRTVCFGFGPGKNERANKLKFYF